MNKKTNLLICLMILLCICIAGCGFQPRESVTSPMRYVESYDGVSVGVPEHPERVLALSSAADTILLGLIEPNRLVGINKLSTYEEYSLEAKRAKLVKPVLGSYPLEKVIALKPDLVIAPDYTSADVIDGLRHMGIPTVVVPTGTTVESVIKNVTDIAHIVGEDEKGQFYAPDLLGLPPRTPFGDERVIAMEPDYIFIPSYKGMDKTLASRYLDNPAFQNLSAVRENRVKPLPAAYLYTMNQHIGEAMLAIMHTVYPQLERNSHD